MVARSKDAMAGGKGITQQQAVSNDYPEFNGIYPVAEFARQTGSLTLVSVISVFKQLTS